MSFVSVKFHYEKYTAKGCGKRENSDVNDITEESLGTKQCRFVYHFKLFHNQVVALIGQSKKESSEGIKEESSPENFRKIILYLRRMWKKVEQPSRVASKQHFEVSFATGREQTGLAMQQQARQRGKKGKHNREP